MSRTNRSVRRLTQQGAALGALLAVLPAAEGCSVHASWQTGSSTSERPVRQERARTHDDAEARARARKRREQELERIDREARERVKQAERQAEEQERAAEADAERERQEAERAAAEAERKRQEEEAAAAAEGAKKPALRRHGVSAGGTFVNADGKPQSGAQSAQDARRAEIEKAMADRKVAIRQKLEQNKADILVAAERKRNEVQASLKAEEQAEAKP